MIGDFYYQANDHHSYLKSLKLVPNQSDEIEDKIAEYHKALRFVRDSAPNIYLGLVTISPFAARF